jgi:peptidoglycan/LPS O-acetylase OafA/YrhL
MAEAQMAAQPGSGLDARITGLDGFRGAMTLMVLVSHFFAEVPNGIAGLSLGWIGVVGFYVLSGFLIGRLILDRKDCANFVTVFYMRRICRMIPAYVIVLLAVYSIYWSYGHLAWVEYHPPFPLWTYATFTQSLYMVHVNALGPHWLAPTWTLAVEEHFYLIAPAALMFTPARHLMKALIAVAVSSVLFRISVFGFGMFTPAAGRVLLPAVADTLAIGLMAAVLIRRTDIDWPRYDLSLRVAGPVSFTLAALLAAVDRIKGTDLFSMFGATAIALGCAAMILAIVRGAVEAKRFEIPALCSVGHMSYCIYLTHLAVLGLMHGLILGGTPDIKTWQQVVVTIAAVPVSIAVGWALYRSVEEPGLHYGRRWQWSRERREGAEPVGPAPQRA